MKGDFTRDTFDPQKHFSRVLMQQGRVLLDADWNEQTSILLHYLQSLAADLIGPHGGTVTGFEVTGTLVSTLQIGKGNYYVDGILCENEGENEGNTLCRDQPDLQGYPDHPLPPTWTKDYNLVYLDVWERHITCLEDDNIREKALGGPNTATRAKVVWQVKAIGVASNWSEANTWEEEERRKEITEQMSKLPCSQARVKVRCVGGMPAGSSGPDYLGWNNRLYRVEIHRDGGAGDCNSGATFKWSRDNGAVAFGVSTSQGTAVFLKRSGQDSDLGLAPGDIVEVVSAKADLDPLKKCGDLFKVNSVEQDKMAVILNGLNASVGSNSLLRRWDHGKTSKLAADNAVQIIEEVWLDLEDGLQVQFQKGQQYLTGDYWLIPVRAATGPDEWPKTKTGDPMALQPNGIIHHYAPLAVFYAKEIYMPNQARYYEFMRIADLRRVIAPLGQEPKLPS